MPYHWNTQEYRHTVERSGGLRVPVSQPAHSGIWHDMAWQWRSDPWVARRFVGSSEVPVPLMLPAHGDGNCAKKICSVKKIYENYFST